MVLLDELSRRGEWGGAVDLVDGGTQGLMLLSQISGRPALILLDAISLGAEPGTVHVLDASDVLRFGAGGPSAHEANAGELLRAAMLTGDLPEKVFVVGIEPESVKTGIGLSPSVAVAVPAAVDRVLDCLSSAGWHPSRRLATGANVEAGSQPAAGYQPALQGAGGVNVSGDTRKDHRN